VKLDVRLTGPPGEAGAAALRGEVAGFAGAWISEARHDPFLPVLAAATATRRLQVGTSVAIAFARSPMTVAMTANDLQLLSGGRFVLGLGTQVKSHIERRYSMPWSEPAARMREYILALRAIWTAWNSGGRLEFRGRFYRHDLMTPYFRPEPNPYGAPRVVLAGVGPMMTAVAGAVADGFFCHAFTTERYLREVTLPLLARARAQAGRDETDFEVCGLFFVVTGFSDAEREESARAARRQIAFYASTPSYRPVLELHGWGDLQGELSALARADRWAEMETLISEEMLNAFAIVAPPERVSDALHARFGGLVSRASLYVDYDRNPGAWQEIIGDIARR
jgi:probable F420-dependent oxidoreductase